MNDREFGAKLDAWLTRDPGRDKEYDELEHLYCCEAGSCDNLVTTSDREKCYFKLCPKCHAANLCGCRGEYECDECDGEGFVPCPENPMGIIFTDCPKCGGRGTIVEGGE